MDPVPTEVFDTYFSCFSAHPLVFKGVAYTTTEHAYHAQRYADPEVIAAIMAAETPRAAWELSQTHKKTQRPDWDEIKRSVMKELFRAKLAQHADVRDALAASAGKAIVKHQDDPYWGDNLDGTGRNELGNVWMELREEIR